MSNHLVGSTNVFKLARALLIFNSFSKMNCDSEEEADPFNEVEETPIAEVEISDELRRFMNLRVSV